MAEQGARQRDRVGVAGRRRRLHFLEVGPADEANLAALREFLAAHVEGFVDEFWEHLRKFDDTRKLLGGEPEAVRLKSELASYFMRMTAGRFDAEYFDERLRAGEFQQVRGLQPQWFVGAFSLFLRLVMQHLATQYRHDPGRLVELLGSLSKVVFLDIGLLVDAYLGGGHVESARAQDYRRSAEAAHRQLREKEAVEQMKADLTSMVVHDLKAPLGAILTVAQLARRKAGGVGGTAGRYFEQIQRSAWRLLEMVQNLLEIEQMQEGQLELRLEPVEVKQVLAECVEEFRAAAEIAGQQLHLVASDTVPRISSDRWLLRRIVNNLVVNAIRHSGMAGRIDVEADYSVEAEYRDGTVRLRVRDTGRGIPAEEQATLFMKYRSRAGRQRRRDDIGLGLVFCKMAVELLGGTIAVDSAPGAGATFTVSLPLRPEPAPGRE